MTTTLLALTFAPNIDRLLRDIQDILFRRETIVSSRALPPIVPIVHLSSTPADAVLDRIRKRHPVTLAQSTTAIHTHEGIVVLPLPLRGFGALADACRSNATAPTSEQVPPIDATAASIHLAWDVERPLQPQTIVLSAQIAAHLPRTSAFWLSVFEIECGEERWWDGCVYRVPYRRRLTVQQR